MQTRNHPKFVTNDVFKKEVGRLDGKINNLTVIVLENQKDIQEIKQTMTTKSDINLVLNRIDHVSKKIDVYDKKAIVHDYRINELESKCDHQEKRLHVLETKAK